MSSQGLEEQVLTQGPGRQQDVQNDSQGQVGGRQRWRLGGLAHRAGAVRGPREDGWEAAPASCSLTASSGAASHPHTAR